MKLRDNYTLVIAGLLVITTMLLRYFVLLKFSFVYTDSDQSIMWQALMDYSNGIFHEPRYYGQAYNTMLEAFLAVPLFKLGLQPFVALPIITTLLSVIPFWIIAYFAFRKSQQQLGLIILSIPLLLPVEYHFISSLPRGFVTGIFIASFGTVTLFYKKSSWSFVVLSGSAVLGYSVSPNSVVLSIPCILYVFLNNIYNPKLYVFGMLGAAVGGIPHVLSLYFYHINPNYNLHRYSLSYSFEELAESFGGLDYYFNNVSPIFWNQGFIWLILLLLGIIFTFSKKKWIEGAVFASSLVLLVFTLGISKIQDSTDSIFFSSSRMYLALPVLLGLLASILNLPRFKNYWLAVPFVLAILSFNAIESEVKEHTNLSHNHVVSIAEVTSVQATCSTIQELCEQEKISLVVVINHERYDFINYGCSSCTEEFPQTLRPSYERRTWRLIEEETTIHENVLIVDDLHDLEESYAQLNSINKNEGFFLLTNNSTPTIELLRSLNLNIRAY